MSELKELAFNLMQSQATMARLEKEQLQDKIKQAKERLPELWTPIY